MLSLHDSLLDHAIALWVERDGAHGRPVAGMSRPARRVAFARGGVKPMARGQDGHVGTRMTLPRADVTQAAMPVGVVVPISSVPNRSGVASRHRVRKAPAEAEVPTSGRRLKLGRSRRWLCFVEGSAAPKTAVAEISRAFTSQVDSKQAGSRK